MAEGPNGRLTWWLLGIFATVIILGVSFIASSITSINSRLNALEILAGTNAEKVKHIEDSTKNIIPDKIDYLTKHSELLNKVSGIESSLKLIEGRVVTMSERLLTVNTRIDSLTFQDKVEERIKGREIR